MHFAVATGYTYVASGEVVANLESFEVYTGLALWTRIGTSLRYDWANAYGSVIDQRVTCNYAFTGATFVLNLSNCQQQLGTTTPGMLSYSNGAAFSAFDRDNDTSSLHCAQSYGSPWWYRSCWDGSLWGYDDDALLSNGAYWRSTVLTDSADDSGNGPGNGWIFVR